MHVRRTAAYVPVLAAAALLAPHSLVAQTPRGGASAAVPTGVYVFVDGYGKLLYRTFLPGNLVYSGVPNGGADAFTAADARGDARHLGTYVVKGDSITIQWGGGGATETKGLALRGTELRLNGFPYQALIPYPAGHRFEGRFTTHSYNSMGIAGGGVMTWGGASSVVFHRDGTFEAARSGMATTSAGNGAAARGDAAGRGRYAIDGNTITFTFADGTVQRALIHPWKGEERAERPSSVNLDGHTYVPK